MMMKMSRGNLTSGHSWPATLGGHAVAMVVSAMLANALPACAESPAEGEQGSQHASAKLPEVVVTAYRLPSLRDEATQGITVITREEIAGQAPATGVDLFRQVPGLQIDQLGGAGGLSSAYIRGSDPNHVLVVIDGVRVNDPTNSRGGGFDLSSLDPNTIERIEILRGASSSLYGADAMGGVINIVTRRSSPTATQGEASIATGGQGYRTLNGQVSANTQLAGFSLGASELRDGLDAAGGRIDLKTFNGSARVAIGEFATLGFNARNNDRSGTSFPDDSGGILYAVRRDLDQKKSRDSIYSASLNWDINKAVTANATLSRYDRVEDINSPGVAPGFRNPIGLPATVSRTDFARENSLVNVVIHLPLRSEISVGAEYQREYGISDATYLLFGTHIPAHFNLERETRSEFIEAKWHSLENLVVRGGIRRDSVSGVDSSTSPSLGIRYQLPGIGGALKANYSEGFKPPSFFALGLPIPLGGNPALRAEHSKGAEVGYEHAFWKAQGNASLSLFNTKYRDLVDFDNTTNRLVNDRGAEIRGGEMEISLKLTASLSLRGHFTRLLTIVPDSGTQLRQRPGKRAGLRATYAYDEHTRISWNTEYVADVFDSSIPTGNLILPSYLRSDIALSFQLTNGTSASLAVDNLFDKRYESFVGFVNPGRRLRVNLTVAF